jgi:hypothetical protein
VFGAEPGGTKCGFTVDGKYGIACLIHCFEEPGFKGDGIRQLSTANFGRDLPGRRGRHQNFVFVVCNGDGSGVTKISAGERGP